MKTNLPNQTGESPSTDTPCKPWEPTPEQLLRSEIVPLKPTDSPTFAYSPDSEIDKLIGEVARPWDVSEVARRQLRPLLVELIERRETATKLVEALLEIMPHLNELPTETYHRLAPIAHAALAASEMQGEIEKFLANKEKR